MEKIYLGDSVYAEIEENMVKLTTWNGFPDDPRNVIFMEGFVVQALLTWMQHVGVLKPLTIRRPTNEDKEDKGE